jgi:YD repeat-containing protein
MHVPGRFVISLSLGVLFAAAAHAQYPDGDKELVTTYKIRSITIESNYSGSSLLTVSKEYDRRGNLKTSTTSSRFFSYRWTYTYDANDRPIEATSAEGKTTSTQYQYDYSGRVVGVSRHAPDGTGDSHETYTLNDNGKISEAVFYNGTSVVDKQRFRYDANGNVIELTKLTPDNRVTSTTKHTYNRTGSGALETLVFDSSGALSSRTTYSYDGEHLLEQKEYDAGGNLRSRHTYARDSKGFVVADVEWDSTGKKSSENTTRYTFY